MGMFERGVMLSTVLVFGCGSSSEPAAGADAGQTTTSLQDELQVTGASVFQATKVVVADQSGATTPAVPIIAGRAAILHADFSLGGKQRATPLHIDGELHLLNAAGVEQATIAQPTRTITRDSNDSSPVSGFNFAMDAAQMTTDAAFKVVMRDHDRPSDPAASFSFPTDGTAIPFGAQTAPDLKVTIVPVQYEADGSGRLPDTNAAQVQIFHDTLYQMYPVSNVIVSVRAPYAWNAQVDAMGNGWDELLTGLIDLRGQDGASADNYYIGSFEAASSIQTFCDQGCIEGVGLLDGKKDPASRVALVLGYAGDYAATTLNQELAHSMGLEHAPCGNPDSIDPKFPYADGGIGVWGYDILASSWIDPRTVSDFMSYCQPVWVSDYTFASIFQQMQYVQSTLPQKDVRGGNSVRSYQALRVLPDGSARDAGFVQAPSGYVTSSVSDVTDASGKVLATSDRFISYGELGGGLLLLPKDNRLRLPTSLRVAQRTPSRAAVAPIRNAD